MLKLFQAIKKIKAVLMQKGVQPAANKVLHQYMYL